MTEDEITKFWDFQNWLTQAGGSALEFLLRAAVCAAIYFVISKVLKRILAVMDRHLEKTGAAPTVRHFMRALIKALVLGFTLVSMIVQLNIVEASSIAALVASAGVGISLAAQGVLSNFAGGVLLLLLKPFREGDFITVKGEDVQGTVEKIELYYTTIFTPERERMVIPNSTLTNKAVVNSGLTCGEKRLSITVGIAYEEDVRRAMGILEKLMDEESRIHAENRRTFVEEMGESSVVIGLRCLVSIQDYIDVRWDMMEKIRLAFKKEQVEIPFNQLDVHLVGTDAGQRELGDK